MYLQTCLPRLSQITNTNNDLINTSLTIKGTQAVRIDFFCLYQKLPIFDVFKLIKCSEHKARFKKSVIMS